MCSRRGWFRLAVAVIVTATLCGAAAGGHPPTDDKKHHHQYSGGSFSGNAQTQPPTDARKALRKCKPGQVHVQGSDPVWANGCGTSTLRIDADPRLEPCCLQHDACYSLCGIPREECERHFKLCLSTACDAQPVGTSPAPPMGEEDSRRECRQNANMFGVGSSAFGQSLYVESQSQFCSCSDAGEAVGLAYSRRVAEIYDRAGLDRSTAASKMVNAQKRISLFMSKPNPAANGGAVMLMQLYEKYPNAIVFHRDDTDMASEALKEFDL